MAEAGRRNWMRWALVASLGLNLAAVGVIGGAVLKGPPPPAGYALWRYARALPEPYGHDLGRALRDSRRDWTGPREALRDQQRAMVAALTADPFAPEAVADVLQAQAEISDDLSARGTAMLLDQIGRMSAEERAAYAAALNEQGPGRRRR